MHCCDSHTCCPVDATFLGIFRGLNLGFTIPSSATDQHLFWLQYLLLLGLLQGFPSTPVWVCAQPDSCLVLSSNTAEQMSLGEPETHKSGSGPVSSIRQPYQFLQAPSSAQEVGGTRKQLGRNRVSCTLTCLGRTALFCLPSMTQSCSFLHFVSAVQVKSNLSLALLMVTSLCHDVMHISLH